MTVKAIRKHHQTLYSINRYAGHTMKLTIIILLITLTGCASQRTFDSIFPDNVKIGVIYPEVKACFQHRHTGLTVFSNFEKSYQNSINWKQRIEKSFHEVASNNNDSVIFINNIDLYKPVGEIYDVNTWNSSYSVKPENEAILSKIIADNSLDILVFSTTFGYGDRSSDCFQYNFETDSRSKKSAILMPESFLTVDAKNANKTLSTFGIYGTILDGYYPENVEVLTKQDFEIINLHLKKQLTESVKLLFKLANIGEDNFEPERVPQYFWQIPQ